MTNDRSNSGIPRIRTGPTTATADFRVIGIPTEAIDDNGQFLLLAFNSPFNPQVRLLVEDTHGLLDPGSISVRATDPATGVVTRPTFRTLKHNLGYELLLGDPFQDRDYVVEAAGVFGQPNLRSNRVRATSPARIGGQLGQSLPASQATHVSSSPTLTWNMAGQRPVTFLVRVEGTDTFGNVSGEVPILVEVSGADSSFAIGSGSALQRYAETQALPAQTVAGSPNWEWTVYAINADGWVVDATRSGFSFVAQ